MERATDSRTPTGEELACESSTPVQVRHRAELVEYRIERLAANLGDRLRRLSLTTYVTTSLDSQPDRVSDGAATLRA